MKRLSLYFILSFCFYNMLNGMIYDNRYFPLYLKPIERKPCSFGHIQVQPFFMRADSAQGELEHIPIPDINGTYDLVQVINSLLKVGTLEENPLRSDLQGISTLPFKREGRIDSQGIAFFYEVPLWYNFALGTSFLFMHVNSRVEFCLDRSCLEVGNGDRQYLFDLNGKLDQVLGVTPPIYNQTVFGDTDLYLRWSCSFPYFFKFRDVGLAFKLGSIIPSSPITPYNNPAAVPVGGQKHWGVYLDLENRYEIKEDWFVGLMFRAIKRLPRTSQGHFPVLFEPYNYGALIGENDINPGWTFVFNPSVRLDGLRDGFGLTALYTLVSHLQNIVNISAVQGTQCNTVNTQDIALNLENQSFRSSWGMEYVTLGAYYDFSKTRDYGKLLPMISFYWDVPVDWLVSKRSARTNAMSFTVDF